DSDSITDNFDKCPNTPLGYSVDNSGCAISTTLRINFTYKSTVVPENAIPGIKKLAEFINNTQNSYKVHIIYKVFIIGHTDNIASKAYNKKLSKQRALSVKKALVSYGVDPKLLICEGKGEMFPIADNSTPEGQYLNRRVEVQLVRE
ncbi:MAG: OmpA family protein, partial [Sulfurimonas sp.]